MTNEFDEEAKDIHRVLFSDSVNHPSHYNIEGRKECIDEMVEEFGEVETIIFAVLSAYKYLYRFGSKEGAPKEQDISKAKWYLDWATDRYNKICNEEKKKAKDVVFDVISIEDWILPLIRYASYCYMDHVRQ